MSTNSKNRLGRGLESLIPTDVDEFAGTSMPEELKIDPSLVHELPIDKIVANPHQPRSHFAETDLLELAISIKQYGIVQPLVVVKSGDGYQLIAGERRLRAAKNIGLKKVPAILRSYNRQEQLEIALVENIQRSELKPLELATAYLKLSDQFNLSTERIGERVGKAQSTVANTMRLLNLEPEAKQALNDDVITEGHARTLLSVLDRDRQLNLLQMIIDGRLSVRQAEELAREFKADKEFTVQKRQVRQAYNIQLSSDLGKHLGTKVAIQKTAKGGKVVIEFYSEEELGRLYHQILGK